MRTCAALAAALLIASPLAACGSDDDGAATDVAVTAPDDDSTAAQADDSVSETGGEAVAPLTGEEICARLSVASVAADTGLDVLRAVPDDDATPQCAYEYANDTNAVSNLTVASMRPQDVNGLTGADAYDFVVRINESIVGDGAETQTVSAGNAAVRLSGAGLHLGVVQAGDRVLTLLIPIDDVDVDAVDRLVATIATTLD